MDKNPQAAATFYRLVHSFVSGADLTTSGVQFYSVSPDEAYDLSLVSERVYGRRDEYLAVLASAGLDSFNQPIPEGQLALPTDAMLMQLKRQAGYESIAEFREDGAPTWLSR
ncbi:MAG: hypothetical protein CMB99_00740 [Flavobacteriaceae bacterium]|nr:hypothetical protein [Flavobacteriaceae bacterium]|tara:strand:- start:915 stop:1250 length:336 start_codon:yes stop_codon:yes gene_type:complete